MTFPVELPLKSYLGAPLGNFTVASGYDFRTAGAMAWLSQLAYETRDPDKVSKALANWQLALKSPIKHTKTGSTDTHGLVVAGWGATIIAFTGTDPLKPKNWLTDFTLGGPEEEIHAGFKDGFAAVQSQIEAAVQARGDQNKRLFIAGHSLGAALAAVAAKFVQETLAEVEGVYTFGMPRCFRPRFAELYENLLGPRTYRLVHGDDVVPTVPPSGLDFRHVGRLLKCPHGGSFEGLQPSGGPSDEPQFSAGQSVGDLLRGIGKGILPRATQPGLLGWFYRWLNPSIGDHLPSRYLHALGQRP